MIKMNTRVKLADINSILTVLCGLDLYCSTALIKQPIYCASFAFVIPECRPSICIGSFLSPFQVNAAPIFLSDAHHHSLGQHTF